MCLRRSYEQRKASTHSSGSGSDIQAAPDDHTGKHPNQTPTRQGRSDIQAVPDDHTGTHPNQTPTQGPAQTYRLPPTTTQVRTPIRHPLRVRLRHTGHPRRPHRYTPQSDTHSSGSGSDIQATPDDHTGTHPNQPPTQGPAQTYRPPPTTTQVRTPIRHPLRVRLRHTGHPRRPHRYAPQSVTHSSGSGSDIQAAPDDYTGTHPNQTPTQGPAQTYRPARRPHRYAPQSDTHSSGSGSDIQAAPDDHTGTHPNQTPT